MKVLNISQAREIFSDMVKGAATQPYFIGSRGVPVAAIVDYERAVSCLPRTYLDTVYESKKRPLNNILKWLEEQKRIKGPYRGRKINLSENADKYIYK